VTETEADRQFFDANGAEAFVDKVKTARWFQDQARAGLIDSHKLGGTWFWTREQLLALIENSFCCAANYGRKPR
jgi:hypothetical protein